MLARVAVLGCLLASGCDAVFRVDHIGERGTDGGGDGGASGIQYVQGAGLALSGITELPVGFESSVQPGSLVVVAIAVFKGILTGVTDSAGNTYVEAQPGLDSDGQSYLHIWFASNVVVGTDRLTVMAKATGSTGTEMTMAIHEYRGAAEAPLDKHVILTGPTGTPVSIGPVESTTDGELYFAALIHDNTNTTTAGPGYTIRQRATESNVGMTPLVTEDMIGRAGTSITATFELATPTSWVGGLYTFR